MGHVTNGTHSSQMEIPNGNFPVFFVNGKRPGLPMVEQRLVIEPNDGSEVAKIQRKHRQIMTFVLS